MTLEETISALETARRGADEDIAAARALLSEVHRTIPRVEAAAARSDAAREEAETKLAGRSRDWLENSARGWRRRRGTLARAAREKRASAMKTGATDFAAAAAAAAAAEREAKRLEALAATKPEEKPPEGWIPSVGQSVTVIVNGMSGAVKSVSGTSVVVQAGLMRLTVDASELEPSATVAPPKKPPAKGRSPAGTQAARRVDALLGGARTPGRGASPPPTNEFGLDFDSFGDDAPVIGDTVRIRKSGVVGTVVDAFDGVLTVQAGRNRLKTPVEGVEFADRGGAKAKASGPSAGGGGKKKSKKKEKKKEEAGCRGRRSRGIRRRLRAAGRTSTTSWPSLTASSGRVVVAVVVFAVFLISEIALHREDRTRSPRVPAPRPAVDLSLWLRLGGSAMEGRDPRGVVVGVRVPGDLARAARLVEHRVDRHERLVSETHLLRRGHRHVVLLVGQRARVLDRTQRIEQLLRLLHLSLVRHRLRLQQVGLLGEDVQILEIAEREGGVEFDHPHLLLARLSPHLVLGHHIGARRRVRGGILIATFLRVAAHDARFATGRMPTGFAVAHLSTSARGPSSPARISRPPLCPLGGRCYLTKKNQTGRHRKFEIG